MSTTEQVTQPVWGTPQAEPPKPKSSRLKLAIIAAVSAVVLAGGGVAVANAIDSDAGTTAQGPGGGNMGQFPGGGGNGRGFGGAGGGLNGALHGDFTASDGNGGYITKRLQSGTVRAVSSTSITVQSADGHGTTFAVGSSTTVNNGNSAIGDVKTGDTVTVVGTVSGDSATATTIADTTLNQGNQGNPPAAPGGN